MKSRRADRMRFEDDSPDEIQHDMADAQRRRVPVVNHDKRRVSMLSRAARDDVANTLESVSQTKHT